MFESSVVDIWFDSIEKDDGHDIIIYIYDI